MGFALNVREALCFSEFFSARWVGGGRSCGIKGLVGGIFGESIGCKEIETSVRLGDDCVPWNP